MNSIFTRIAASLGFKKFSVKQTDADAEALRAEFKERYHGFRLLLAANTRALERMSGMEQALQGRFSFDTAFVRASCTGVIVDVHRMIREMERLAPGKYGGLPPRFAEIRDRINRIITSGERIVQTTGGASGHGGEDVPLLLDFDQADAGMAHLIGDKMAALCDIRKRTDCRVPPGFVVTTRAFRRFFEKTGLQYEINSRFQLADLDDPEALQALSADVQQRILHTPLPEDIENAIQSFCARLAEQEEKNVRFALRSSALGEDSRHSSFAGQYHSELNVHPESVISAYKTVLAAKYAPHAVLYRRRKGFRDEDALMAVGCMVMVDAASGGVIYTRNPVDSSTVSPAENDAIHIHAVHGLPKGVVDGSTPFDRFVVSKNEPPEIIRREIAGKNIIYVLNKEDGVDRIPVDAGAAAEPSVMDNNLIRLSRMAVTLETHYGSPRDIEWAIDRDADIILLQCRPLHIYSEPDAPENPPGDAEDEADVILSGSVTASPGAAWGEAFVVSKAADVLRFPKGAVLVVKQALPKWAVLLDRASAVVSEQGGMAGHLATVCREFGIPALFGVEDAADTLSKGGRITVDADRRVIFRGAKKHLCKKRPRKENKMAGTPVHKILKQAGRQIIPLNLLEPDSIDFRPEKCTTLHDITRFIHEKSVHEMFRFGQNRDFPERAAKQLVYDSTPMQWWVLDLEDGFSKPSEGKFVHFENIASIPMIAFWEGFTAVPWDGPPAVDGGGMMSVMFRSTANTALTTGVRTQYARQNYFMISRNYCSLNARLGYHFAIMEALVGERIRENYISFRFKGGAADRQRRHRRATFIGDILEDNGFTVKIRYDHLSARMEHYSQEHMVAHIKVLGYLNLHTRQLDMIMNDAVRIDYYDRKIRGDIEGIISGANPLL